MPVTTDVDGYAYGGRGQHWLNDKLRVGVTGMSETTGEADQQAYGADIQLRHSDTTFLEAEISHAKGLGFSTSRSYDGGLTISVVANGDERNRLATARRVRGQLDLADIAEKGVKGRVAVECLPGR
jgi:hypothetical protein